MEKRLAPGEDLTKQRVLVIAPLQHRLVQKGQEVEAKQKRPERLLAMPKVVLQMGAFGLEHMVIFSCDLPQRPRPACAASATVSAVTV